LLVGEVWAYTQHMALSEDQISQLMRRDLTFATPEDNFTLRDYKALLFRAHVDDAGEDYTQEVVPNLKKCTAKFRLYINALPSMAAAVFLHLRKNSYQGMQVFKLWGSSSWQGRRDLLVAYFDNGADACAAGRTLALTLPECFRADPLPGTLQVGPGLGVAWDPQYLCFEGTPDECFGPTHTVRYAKMIHTFLQQSAGGRTQRDFVHAFARWMSSNTNPLHPYNPPKVLEDQGDLSGEK
jgi:hypothetical protein